MQGDESPKSIRYAGPPSVSAAGREVFSFHLHRYLSGWLRETGCERVMVTVGFADATADLGSYRIDIAQGTVVESGWTHRDLEDAWRFGNGRLVWEGPAGESVVFDVVAILDESNADGEPGSALLGFVTARADEGLSDEEYTQFSHQAAEAIRVARRNGVRLFFDEQKDLPVKSLLYEAMDRLPEWVGCDHSAAVLVTHDLDAVTLEDSTEGIFNVLAERVYFSDSEGGDRLVGMAVDCAAREDLLLGDALKRHRNEPDRRYLRYRRDDDGVWRFEESDTPLNGWHEMSDRCPESTLVLVPLVHRSHGERDLLGFVSLSWRNDFSLPPSSRQVLGELGSNLARLLRQSPLYTLSVRKMWVIRQVGDRVEAALGAERRGEKALEGVIGSVSELVAEHVDVPSFAIGYLKEDDPKRTVRYVHPHGWTRFDDLDLAVDVARADRVDSGISALAMRLRRPVVLAGGHGEGERLAFKNHLWVDEEAGKLFDARAIGPSVEELREKCRPLREYYKPARETAYATLAYPMIFSETLTGVLTVEVEKTTDWLWWTGFGGHLFWDMIAREMAMGLYWLRGD